MLDKPKSREHYESDRIDKGATVKGFEVVDQETLAADKVELVVKLHIEGLGSELVSQQMVKVGSNWEPGRTS
jgi:hypothetical protein